MIVDLAIDKLTQEKDARLKEAQELFDDIFRKVRTKEKQVIDSIKSQFQVLAGKLKDKVAKLILRFLWSAFVLQLKLLNIKNLVVSLRGLKKFNNLDLF